MSKFQVGEIAVHVGYKDFAPGEEVEILIVGPFPPGTEVGTLSQTCCEPTDYFIRSLRDGGRGFAAECDLRKRRPPGADIVREFMHELPREVTE